MYVPLRLHSEYSLVDSTIRLPELIAQAKAFGLPALAITDEQNLFALVKFVKACESAGIKPIIGSDCILARGIDQQAQRSRFTLLCKDQQGYLNLCKLLSKVWTERSKASEPVVHWDWLQQHSAGLFVLLGFESDVGQALAQEKPDLAAQKLTQWQGLFGGQCVIELSRCGRALENELVNALAQLAQAQGVPAVATNPAVFLNTAALAPSHEKRRQKEDDTDELDPDVDAIEALQFDSENQASSDATAQEFDSDFDDFTAHEARVCIHDRFVLGDASRPKRHTDQQYLKSPAEMAALFPDLTQALSNTMTLAQMCNVTLKLGTYYLPKFPTPNDESADAFLLSESEAGLRGRIEKLRALEMMACTEEAYFERLKLEQGVIQRMGFAGYFLIVSEFIRWAKQNGIPVGPGRGSGAGSLVAYALSITDIDPIKYELLFERFLNPERISMPDFDVDFCMDRRDEVIQHVSDLYGAEKVSQIITYGTMAAKACVRDAGRVLGFSFGHIDSIAKLIPSKPPGLELQDFLKSKDSSELRAVLERDDDARTIMNLALKLEGLTRNAGKHAGGVVIAPSALTDFSPLYSEGFDPESVGELPVTQFDKDDVESIGLVKFDFLGLRTLTIIDWAVRAVNALPERQENPLDITALPLDDGATFALLQSGRTTGIFQLESRGMKGLAQDLQPSTFEDIIALGALFRPGPLQSGMVKEFVERKHGRLDVTYQHPALETVLKPTYGVIVYQEQVMQIAQVLANYTLGGADMLRRAMGKKDADQMAKQRAIFNEGAAKNAVSADVAKSIFDLMEKFAEYGFNKSHSAAYALVSYQTAFLKAHYPAQFMAAVLSSESDNTEKIVEFLQDAREFNLRILPPDVQHSQIQFCAQEGPMTIRYGLSAVKGVGHAVCACIVENRLQGGIYADFFDFVQRISPAKPNRRTLEALIDSGALDAFAAHRALLHESLPDAIKASERLARDDEAGQVDMFGNTLRAPPEQRTQKIVPAFGLGDMLGREKAVLGGYFSGHPLDEIKVELAALNCPPIKELIARAQPRMQSKGEGRPRSPEFPTLVAGEIQAIRKMGKMAFAKIADSSRASVEIGFFGKHADQFNALLKDGTNLLVYGALSWDSFSSAWQIKAKNAYRLEEAIERACFALHLQVNQPGTSFSAKLMRILQAHRGGHARVRVQLALAQGNVALEFGAAWRVAANLALKRELQVLGGVTAVELALESAKLAVELETEAPRLYLDENLQSASESIF
jgi:DNA polymerase III subunit alpha